MNSSGFFSMTSLFEFKKKFNYMSIRNSEKMDIPMEGAEETGRIEEQRSVGQREVALADGAQVLARDVRLTDRPRGQVQNAVTVVFNLGKQLRHAALRPVFANDRKDVAQHV